MAGNVKLMTSAGGGVILDTATTTATDVTVQVPVRSCTLYGTGASTITSGTAVASTSGTSIDFTSIPSWVKRITVMFSGVSLSGTANVYVQLGTSGGIQNTGYSTQAVISSSPSNVSSSAPTTAFFAVYLGNASRTGFGSVVLTLLDAANNIWVETGIAGELSGNVATSTGTKTLSGVLTSIRVTTSNGTDTFDAGSINILYE